MSRKDPRRRIVVPVSLEQRNLLRAAVTRSGRKGSLADQLRRIVTVELAKGLEDLGEQAYAGSGLPLQLPQKIRSKIDLLARDWGKSPSYVVQQALAQHMGSIAIPG